MRARRRYCASAASLVAYMYEQTVDRESAYEMLEGRVAEAGADGGRMDKIGGVLGGDGKRQTGGRRGTAARIPPRPARSTAPPSRRRPA